MAHVNIQFSPCFAYALTTFYIAMVVARFDSLIEYSGINKGMAKNVNH